MPSHTRAASGCPACPAVRSVADHCDDLYCLLEQQEAPFAVASFYRSFPDLTDDEVRGWLEGRAER